MDNSMVGLLIFFVFLFGLCVYFIIQNRKLGKPSGCSLVIGAISFMMIIGGILVIIEDTSYKSYSDIDMPSYTTPQKSTNESFSSSEFGASVSTSDIYFFYATGAAKDYIKGKLKYPASSEFIPESSMKVYKASGYSNRYTVVGAVDAANSFNAKERKYFQVTMQITEKSSSQYSYSVVNYELY